MPVLNKDDLRELDREFTKYQYIEDDKAVVWARIMHPWRPSDNNVGGGRSTGISKPEEEIAIKLDDDPQWQRLELREQHCKAAIERMDDEQYKIYKLRYRAGNYYDWNTVGKLLHYSHAQIYRKRYALLALLAQECGMLSKDETKTGSSLMD
jgi:RinA family phage transcriptional activator